MVAPEKPDLVREFNLIRQKQADCFDRLLSPINLQTVLELVSIHRLMPMDELEVSSRKNGDQYD